MRKKHKNRQTQQTNDLKLVFNRTLNGIEIVTMHQGIQSLSSFLQIIRSNEIILAFSYFGYSELAKTQAEPFENVQKSIVQNFIFIKSMQTSFPTYTIHRSSEIGRTLKKPRVDEIVIIPFRKQ